MSEHEYTVEGFHAGRIVETLRNLAAMMTHPDARIRLTDDQMRAITGGHAVANNRVLAAANMRDTAKVIADQMTDDDPQVNPVRND
jgi:hypothetical protein